MTENINGDAVVVIIALAILAVLLLLGSTDKRGRP